MMVTPVSHSRCVIGCSGTGGGAFWHREADAVSVDGAPKCEACGTNAAANATRIAAPLLASQPSTSPTIGAEAVPRVNQRAVTLLYAEPDVVTTYEREIQPDGSAERHTVS